MTFFSFRGVFCLFTRVYRRKTGVPVGDVVMSYLRSQSHVVAHGKLCRKWFTCSQPGGEVDDGTSAAIWLPGSG